MLWTLLKVLVAIIAFFCIYLTGTFIVRSFMHAPPAEPEIVGGEAQFGRAALLHPDQRRQPLPLRRPDADPAG